MSPSWDCWEEADTPADYLHIQLNMLTELLIKYGPISQLFFDFHGANRQTGVPGRESHFNTSWQNINAHVRAISPQTLMLPGADGCENPGEGGDGMYPVWNAIDNHGKAVDFTLGEACREKSGSRAYDINGTFYVAHDSDLTIQNPGV